MELLTEAGINKAIEAEKSSQLEKSSNLPMLPNASETASEEEIAHLVEEVEVSKQVRPPLTDQQRLSLILDLAGLSLPISRLREMAESVKIKPTYGTIAFEHWISSRVMLEADVVAEHQALENKERRMWERFDFAVEDRINERIARAQAAVSSGAMVDDLSIVNLMEAENAVREWGRKLNEHAQRVAERERAKLRRVSAALRLMSRENRIEIFAEAERRGLCGHADDKMIDHAYLFSDRLRPVMDQLAASERCKVTT
jgi:hypothetical protein